MVMNGHVNLNYHFSESLQQMYFQATYNELQLFSLHFIIYLFICVYKQNNEE